MRTRDIYGKQGDIYGKQGDIYGKGRGHLRDFKL